MNVELKILGKWLEDKDSDLFDIHEGVVESKMRNMKQEIFQEIGSMLNEILEMSDKQKMREL